MSVIGELIYKIKGDTKGFDKSIKTSEKSLKGFDSQIGGVLASLGATGLIKSLVDSASEAEETGNKFNVTFKGIEESATESQRVLQEQFGLSGQASQALLSNTSDLLQGFGFAKDESLNLSTNVQQLAVDLASFTNVQGGAKTASDALTKALLGEREQLKSLGIAITEADLKAYAEDQGLVYKEVDRATKAQLTYELAVKQSQNAIGDFARSQDSYANQVRVFQSSITDLQSELGSNLLPIATGIVSVLDSLVDAFADAPQFVKVLTVSLLGLVAVLPVLSIGINAINASLVALATNPFILGILAGGAIIAGVAVLAEKFKEASEVEFDSYLKTMPKDVEEIAKKADLANKEFQNINITANSLIESTLDASDAVNYVAKKYKVTKEEALKLLLAQIKIGSEGEKYLKDIQTAYEVEKDTKKLNTELLDLKTKEAKERRQAVINAKLENEAEAERIETFSLIREAIEQEAELKKDVLAEEIRLGIKSKEDQTSELIKIEEQLQEDLFNLKLEYGDLFGTANEQKILDSVAREKALRVEAERGTQSELDAEKDKAKDEDIARVTQQAIDEKNIKIAENKKALEEQKKQAEELAVNIQKSIEITLSIPTESLSSALQELKDDLSDATSETENLDEALINSLEGQIDNVEQLTSFVKGFTEAIGQAIAGDEVGALITLIKTFLEPTIGSLGELLAGDLGKALDGVFDAFNDVSGELAGALVPIFIDMLEVLIPLLEVMTPIVGILAEVLGVLEPLISASLQPLIYQLGLWADILDVLEEALTPILNLLTTVTKAIEDFAEGIRLVVETLYGGLGSTIGDQARESGGKFRDLLGFANGGIIEPRQGGVPIRVAENGSGEVMYNTGSTGKEHTEQMAQAIASRLPQQGFSGNITIMIDGTEFDAFMQDSFDNNRVVAN